MITPWYALAYVKLERIAWRHGYCLAIHGSMARDLDLIAIPWTDDAGSPAKLLSAFKRFIIGKSKINYKIGEATPKPHGRMGYTMPIGHDGYYLDISIMPRMEEK